MSNYEFWDELGKIFNAVLAYQEKTAEFNKRFINPWIRLGNVFDKQDRNKEAVDAYEKAIEIDPANAQNWYELGNIHFKMACYEEAIDAFNRAIELDPAFGSPYSNLALTLVTQGKYVQAIPLYRKSIELLEEAKDKAVAWNRLGNVYRKLNEYDLAVEAFQKADELDQDNAGFRDSLDEVSEGPTVVAADSSESTGQTTTVTVSPIELILADSRAEEAASPAPEETVVAVEASTEVPTQPALAVSDAMQSSNDSQPEEPSENATPESQPEPVAEPAIAASTSPVSDAAAPSEAEEDMSGSSVEAIEQPAVAQNDTASSEEISVGTEPVVVTAAESDVESEKVSQPGEETVTVIVQSTIETFTETVTLTGTSTGTSDAALIAEATEKSGDESVPAVEESIGSPLEQTSQRELAEADPPPEGNVEATVEAASDGAVNVEVSEPGSAEPVAEEHGQAEEQTAESPVLSTLEGMADAQVNDVERTEHVAYEEYLKDSNEPTNMFETEAGAEATESENVSASREPVAKIDPAGELQIEMDTKNAHVWNELGNVYYNTGAFDDAIIAYSKAIELDRWFAWPYSNLALAYVQKGRFAEAILLYQRSVELFANEKDKAISWNRLGNVYRRLNEYDNAIAAYQRADELDPDNTTLSLQSRFSLLGSYAMQQKPSYAS